MLFVPQDDLLGIIVGIELWGSERQPLKEHCPIEVTDNGIVICFSEEQP